MFVEEEYRGSDAIQFKYPHLGKRPINRRLIASSFITWNLWYWVFFDVIFKNFKILILLFCWYLSTEWRWLTWRQRWDCWPRRSLVCFVVDKVNIDHNGNQSKAWCWGWRWCGTVRSHTGNPFTSWVRRYRRSSDYHVEFFGSIIKHFW